MCENCDKVKERAWAEIRDLMNYNRVVNGPLSEAIKKRIESAKSNGIFPEDEDEAMNIVESVRAQMISDRCVAIARSCEGSRFHMVPAAMIAGAWAGDLLEAEMLSRIMKGGIGILTGLWDSTDDYDDE